MKPTKNQYAIALLVVLAVVAVLTTGNDERTRNTRAWEESHGTPYDAVSNCKTFTKQRLKAPSTATVTPTRETEYLGDGKWRVAGTYDAQNSFGAMLRGPFVCDVQHTTGHNYDLIALTMK